MYFVPICHAPYRCYACPYFLEAPKLNILFGAFISIYVHNPHSYVKLTAYLVVTVEIS